METVMPSAEILDLVVVLKPEAAEQMDAAVSLLKILGMMVSSIDADNGIVEGTLAAEMLAEVRSMPSVAYARVDFDYVSESPEDVSEPDESGHNSED
jgi:hypothetical protein